MNQFGGNGAIRASRFIELDISHITPLYSSSTSTHKVLITNNFIEVFTRESVPSGNSVTVDRGDRSEEYLKTSRSQSYQRVKSLCYGNFKEFDKFVTLTFSPSCDFDITDIDVCNKKREVYMRKLEKSFPGVRWICIPEKQKSRDAVHYHILCDLPFIPQENYHKFTDLWGHGYTKFQAIKDFDKQFEYLIKYVGKDFGASDHFKGRRRYYCSRNLIRTIEVRGSTADQIVLDLITKNIPVFRSRFYDTPYQGRIYYSSYRVDRVLLYDSRSRSAP